MRPAAVLFDCDGVIVDSEPILFRQLQDDLGRHGLALPDAEIDRLFLGGTVPGAMLTARELGADLPDGWVADFYARLYLRLAEGTPLIPGIEAAFDALDAAGVPYAVGSNGSIEKMGVTLGQHPTIYRRLEGRMFSGQALGKPKPAPDLYLHAAKALGVEPKSCVVIEDSPTGARAARAAGIRCFGYAAHGDGKALANEGAVPFRSMLELPGLLDL